MARMDMPEKISFVCEDMLWILSGATIYMHGYGDGLDDELKSAWARYRECMAEPSEKRMWELQRAMKPVIDQLIMEYNDGCVDLPPCALKAFSQICMDLEISEENRGALVEHFVDTWLSAGADLVEIFRHGDREESAEDEA